jgi:hypothetical protein
MIFWQILHPAAGALAQLPHTCAAMFYYCNTGGFYATWQMRGAATPCHSESDRPRANGWAGRTTMRGARWDRHASRHGQAVCPVRTSAGSGTW